MVNWERTNWPAIGNYVMGFSFDDNLFTINYCAEENKKERKNIEPEQEKICSKKK